MEDYIMTIVKRTSIFMVLAQIFVHFCPSASYEKYFKFLTGMMAALMMFLPLMEVFQKGSIEEYKKQINCYLNELEQMSMQEIPQFETSEQDYLAVTGEEIRDKLNESGVLGTYTVKKAELEEAEDGKDGKDGKEEIRVRLYVENTENTDGKIRIRKVEKIQLETGEKETGAEIKTETKTEIEIEKLQQAAARLLEIEEEYVEVALIE